MKKSGMPASKQSQTAPYLTGPAYKAIMEQLQEGVVITSLDGTFRRMNQTAASLYGFTSPDEFERRLPMLGQVFELRTYPDQKLLKPKDWPLSQLQSGRSEVHRTLYVKRTDIGREVILEYTGKLIRSSRNNPALAVLTLRDVTSQRQAEAEQAKLLATAARQSAFFATALDGIITIDHTGTITEFNPAAERIFGYQRSEVVGKEMAEVIVPHRYRDAHRRGLANFLRTGHGPLIGKLIEITALRRDGSEFPVELTIARIGDDDPPSFMGTLRDITERKRQQADLLASEAKYAATFNDAPVGIVHTSPKGKFLLVNQRFCDMLGYSPEELTNKSFLDITHPDDRTDDRQAMQRLTQGTLDSYNREKRYVHKDGSTVWVNIHVAVQHDESQAVSYFLVTVEDITKRRQAEEKLRQSEEDFRVLANNMSQLAWVCDQHGNRTWFNNRWYEYTGSTFEEMRGLGWRKVHHPDYVKAVLKRFNRSIKQGVEWEDTFPLRGKDGHYRWFLTRAVPIRDDKGQIRQWFGTNTDIEDVRRRKALEYETAQLKEINHAKDEFIALASHQLRTPATGVKQYIGMLLQGYFGELDDQQREVVQTAYDSNERQLDIINALLNVARLDAGKVSLQREPCRIDQLLKNIIREQTEAFQLRNQTLEIQIKPATANVDSRLIRMVLENILDNASKYTPEDKAITVRLTGGAKNITVSIADQGVGISQRDQAKLFQKFSRIDNDLSTLANGSGLGLYWAKKIVDLHNGSISVESKARQGSTFTITLPKK